MIFKKRANKKAACRILDGIVEVANNEMLLHGQYITHVVDKDLLHAGSVCGGRHACLLGSAALSARIPKGAAWENFDKAWRSGLDTKPSLRLAAEALDAEAVARVERAVARNRSEMIMLGARVVLSSNTLEPGRRAEAYFEHFLPVLHGSGRNTPDGSSAAAHTRRSIISLVEAARARIEAGEFA